MIRKDLFWLVLPIVIAAFPGAAWSEPVPNDGPTPAESYQGSSLGDRENERGTRDEFERRKPMEGPMGKSGMMMPPTMVASSDGGVIVLSGHQISKYDANLNLVKEVSLKKGLQDKRNQERSQKKQRVDEPVAEKIDGTSAEEERLLDAVLDEAQPS